MSHDPAGSPRPFDFGEESHAEQDTGAANPFRDPESGPARQRIGLVALIGSLAAAVLVGLGGYLRSAGHVANSADAPSLVDLATRWIALTALCAVVGLLAVVFAVIAIVRARPRPDSGAGHQRSLAVIALICALVLPWIALWLGSGLAPQPPPAP